MIMPISSAMGRHKATVVAMSIGFDMPTCIAGGCAPKSICGGGGA